MSVKVFVEYHIDRFKSYWSNEKRTARKDIMSARLFSRVGLMFSIGFLLFFIVTMRYDYLFASVAFMVYGIAVHIYRDYRRNYHTGWKRRKVKESAMNES